MEEREVLLERLQRILSGEYASVASVMEQIRSAVDNKAENRIALGRAGACKLIAECLDVSSVKNNANSCAEVLSTICELCGYGSTQSDRNFCPENISEFGECGACESVVWCLQRHIRSEFSTREACRAIRALAYDNSTNLGYLWDRGGCEAVVAALVSSRDDPVTCECACWALMGLAFDDNISSRCGKNETDTIIYSTVAITLHH